MQSVRYAGGLVTYKYDDSGRLIAVTDSLGLGRQFDWPRRTEALPAEDPLPTAYNSRKDRNASTVGTSRARAASCCSPSPCL